MVCWTGRVAGAGLVCIAASGKTLWQGKCASTPEAIAAAIRTRAPEVIRIGLESGPLSAWHWHELKKLGLPVACLAALHAKATLLMGLNKSGRNDAHGLAQTVRTGGTGRWPSRGRHCGPDPHGPGRPRG